MNCVYLFMTYLARSRFVLQHQYASDRKVLHGAACSCLFHDRPSTAAGLALHCGVYKATAGRYASIDTNFLIFLCCVP